MGGAVSPRVDRASRLSVSTDGRVYQARAASGSRSGIWELCSGAPRALAAHAETFAQSARGPDITPTTAVFRGFEQPLPAVHNAFVVVYRGSLAVAGTELRRGRMAILANPRPDFRVGGGGAMADGVVLEAGAEGARAILVAGRPLNEPIVQYGPFVMNTKEEIFQAVDDFRAGRLA